MMDDDYTGELDRREAIFGPGLGWIGHPAAVRATASEVSVHDAPEEWEVVAVERIPDPLYEYDDLALLLHKEEGTLVLLRTSGCSCPAPTETWGEVAAGTKQQIREAIDRELTSWGYSHEDEVDIRSLIHFQAMRRHVA